MAHCVIVVGQCTVTYLEERQSGNVKASLTRTVPLECKVIRGLFAGQPSTPADMRISHTIALKVECGSLSGEPDAFQVSAASTHEEPHETRNLVFHTGQCTEGSAYGVVVRTAIARSSAWSTCSRPALPLMCLLQRRR